MHTIQHSPITLTQHYTTLSNTYLGTVCKISMNCVSCVVGLCYLLELTLKTRVSNTMNTVGISSNALFGNSANNFFWTVTSLLLLNFYSTLDIWWLPFCFCLCKNYVKRLMLSSVLAGRKALRIR